ncbi:MAG: hypothetical protein JXA43_03705 [Candidatus Diapherotrites archaeon]|nr:hypothetical protein [Candidatus Diapherotrites archaeon]
MIELSLVIGIFGMLFLLTAFVLDELEKVLPNTVLYNALNVVGAILLLYYAYTINSLPFIFINIIWMIFATYKLIKISRK